MGVGGAMLPVARLSRDRLAGQPLVGLMEVPKALQASEILNPR